MQDLVFDLYLRCISLLHLRHVEVPNNPFDCVSLILSAYEEEISSRSLRSLTLWLHKYIVSRRNSSRLMLCRVSRSITADCPEILRTVPLQEADDA